MFKDFVITQNNNYILEFTGTNINVTGRMHLKEQVWSDPSISENNFFSPSLNYMGLENYTSFY